MIPPHLNVFILPKRSSLCSCLVLIYVHTYSSSVRMFTNKKLFIYFIEDRDAIRTTKRFVLSLRFLFSRGPKLSVYVKIMLDITENSWAFYKTNVVFAVFIV